MKKTNAARILDGLKIKYELLSYAVDESDVSAKHVAEQVGLPAGKIFKTLVVHGDKQGILMAVVPGNGEIDLKALAVSSSNKKVELVPLKEVLPLTGYIRGGVSPLGAKKHYPVYIDESCNNWPTISISAGIRGCQIVISPADLLKAVQGTLCAIVRRN